MIYLIILTCLNKLHEINVNFNICNVNQPISDFTLLLISNYIVCYFTVLSLPIS